jgi:hypothetical protein
MLNMARFMTLVMKAAEKKNSTPMFASVALPPRLLSILF